MPKDRGGPPGKKSNLSVSNWQTLPSNRRDKAFWLALNDFLAPSLQEEFPLASGEFRSLPLSGRTAQDASPLVNEAATKAANEQRDYYNDITLWNPLSLAVRLRISVGVVIEQLLLANEYGLVSMQFVITCRSCGCDMLRVTAVSKICFRATYHQTNVIWCPMCTERTEVSNLGQVAVFFQEPSPPPLLQRKHHRLFLSEEAQRRRLDSYFCPPGASFAFRMRLPEGRYLLIASGAGIIVELHVATGVEYLERERPFHTVTVLMEKFLEVGGTDAEGTVKKRPVIRVDHGKLMFRVFNGTQYGSYLDFYIGFDERLEFLALKPPVVATVPLVLHHASRGLRSPLFRLFTPSPPGTRIPGVYVLHAFTLPGEEFEEPISAGSESTLAIIREVHRYSLEDHHGLLLSVGSGGTVFESSFLSFTAALACSLCFAQRVVTRLGEHIAALLACSITEGAMYMASFQGQYDDDENVRSSYPDVQMVGPVVHASTHPPVLASNNSDTAPQSSVGCNVRFELRSVTEDHSGTCLCPEAGDEMLPYLLSFLEEHLNGVTVLREPQALVVVVPLATLNAMVMLPTLLDPTTYTKELCGPFG
ncbi:hypothetical protein DQ04_00151190 [Trypanosoma grayi]|uniref:hypothetical protein n=1 Tax=Trypanosoma grayi TaxID=71804 RepID=UPI0004F4193A|nr:hypothetical protein DQ04_00151190 [Trypanosoma grayi]KEG15200.1 hypothetical protein DQ04_00151190 [Trypanosoma grayi]